jgi:hypothetical protein
MNICYVEILIYTFSALPPPISKICIFNAVCMYQRLSGWTNCIIVQ